MKRIAIFAHYDCDGIVDDYVIYYLRGLAHVADRILFVSDCELRAGEAAKIEGLAELVFAGQHGEYDFGSWKRGLAHLNYDLAGWDELILANNSCYAPVYPFEDVFERMSSVSCDFWSPSNNQIKGKFDHLSSYFLVFRCPVLEDEDFLCFWKQVERQPNASAVIAKYERRLSMLICEKGYSYGSLLPPTPIASFLRAGFIESYLLKYRSSWLKVRLLRDNPLRAVGLGRALSKIGDLYPRALIDAHMIRMLGTPSPRHYKLRLIGSYELEFGPLTLKSKIKRNKKRPQGRLLWKIYFKVFRVTVFGFVWPFRA